MKLSQIVAFLSFVFLVAACGKEDAKQNPGALTYPNLTQISVVASQPVMANSIARLSNAAKLSVHSNVYRTANPSDNTHFSILFYHVPSIDKNRTHLAVEAKQLAMRVDFNAEDGKLTAVHAINEKVTVRMVIGTAKLNGNLITIESLNFGHAHIRKFLNIPDKSVFQKEQNELRTQISDLSLQHKDLITMETTANMIEREIISLRNAKGTTPAELKRIDNLTKSLEPLKREILSRRDALIASDKALVEKVARIDLLEIIIRESN